MSTYRPKFVTFDCYGTLTYFDMAGAARRVFADRLPGPIMDEFVRRFAAYRLDEILGAWKPYQDVIRNAVARTCKSLSLPFGEADARPIIAEVPTWGPHADVPSGLARVAQEIPLVILSNSMKDLIPHNVSKLGAPFHAVYTAEEAGAYKPRFQAFEFLLDSLGCGPEDITHVSSSFRYDLMSAHDLGIRSKVWVNRGHEPANPYYGYTEIPAISQLPKVFGL